MVTGIILLLWHGVYIFRSVVQGMGRFHVAISFLAWSCDNNIILIALVVRVGFHSFTGYCPTWFASAPSSATTSPPATSFMLQTRALIVFLSAWIHATISHSSSKLTVTLVCSGMIRSTCVGRALGTLEGRTYAMSRVTNRDRWFHSFRSAAIPNLTRAQLLDIDISCTGKGKVQGNTHTSITTPL